MKRIALSFDDARNDFYTRAFPILKRYKLPSTLNVISDYIREGKEKTNISFPSSEIGMKKADLLICHYSGLVEIACHGAEHLNTRKDIESNISDLHYMGINEPLFGFASPNSELTELNKNEHGVWDLVRDGKLLYVRSGIQIRREGLFYTLLSLIDRYFHSNTLFYYLNRSNTIKGRSLLNNRILPSVAVFSYTKLHQIISFIERQKDSTAIILMFHSVLEKNDEGYGCDRYYWDAKTFEELCDYLKSQGNIRVCMTKDLIKT